MSIPYIPTAAERDLLDTARRVLGGNLFEFLLSGSREAHHPDGATPPRASGSRRWRSVHRRLKRK
jgi:hypothetical protein